MGSNLKRVLDQGLVRSFVRGTGSPLTEPE